MTSCNKRECEAQSRREQSNLECELEVQKSKAIQNVSAKHEARWSEASKNVNAKHKARVSLKCLVFLFIKSHLKLKLMVQR